MNLDILATEIHWTAKKNYLDVVTSWFGFAELNELNPEFEKYSQQQMLRAMARGVRLGWFSEPYWRGTGLTPWAGSARRQRMWDVVDNG